MIWNSLTIWTFAISCCAIVLSLLTFLLNFFDKRNKNITINKIAHIIILKHKKNCENHEKTDHFLKVKAWNLTQEIMYAERNDATRLKTPYQIKTIFVLKDKTSNVLIKFINEYKKNNYPDESVVFSLPKSVCQTKSSYSLLGFNKIEKWEHNSFDAKVVDGENEPKLVKFRIIPEEFKPKKRKYKWQKWEIYLNL